MTAFFYGPEDCRKKIVKNLNDPGKLLTFFLFVIKMPAVFMYTLYRRQD
jgi:hypothetical protein